MVHSMAMNAGAGNAKVVRLSQLCKLRECQQVAAVCYRLRGGAIEFLLVQTRGSGRWTFPKGGAEPGLTHAQAAALEAFEEAGVHGRMEEASFAQYIRRKGVGKSGARRNASKIVVNAYLCEVARLSTPKESNRNRTWFSVQEAKRCLLEGRKREDGPEFARVVGRAVARIQRLRGNSGVVAYIQSNRPLRDTTETEKDALQKIQFEALTPAHVRLQAVSLASHARSRVAGTGEYGTGEYFVPAGATHRRVITQCEVVPFSPLRLINRSPKLLSGTKKVKALGTGAKLG